MRARGWKRSWRGPSIVHRNYRNPQSVDGPGCSMNFLGGCSEGSSAGLCPEPALHQEEQALPSLEESFYWQPSPPSYMGCQSSRDSASEERRVMKKLKSERCWAKKSLQT